MSELTICNYCSMLDMQARAEERGVDVIIRTETTGEMKGWVSARYSDKEVGAMEEQLVEALRAMAEQRNESSTTAITQAFAVPPLLLGNTPEPRSMIERGSALIAQAEAFGMDPADLRDPDVDYVSLRRLRERLGIEVKRGI